MMNLKTVRKAHKHGYRYVLAKRKERKLGRRIERRMLKRGIPNEIDQWEREEMAYRSYNQLEEVV